MPLHFANNGTDGNYSSPTYLEADRHKGRAGCRSLGPHLAPSSAFCLTEVAACRLSAKDGGGFSWTVDSVPTRKLESMMVICWLPVSKKAVAGCHTYPPSRTSTNSTSDSVLPPMTRNASIALGRDVSWRIPVRVAGPCQRTLSRHAPRLARRLRADCSSDILSASAGHHLRHRQTFPLSGARVPLEHCLGTSPRHVNRFGLKAHGKQLRRVDLARNSRFFLDRPAWWGSCYDLNGGL